MKRIALFILFFLCIPTFLKAAESATVLQYDVKCSIENNRCVHLKSILIEINNKAGEKYTSISIPYSKREKLQIVNAQIEDLQGNIIRTLKKSDLKEVSDIEESALYQDRFVKKFELKHNIYPYRIRYQYKYIFEEFHELIDWYPYIDEHILIREATLEVVLPLNFKTKLYSNGFLTSLPDTLNSTQVYKFRCEDVKWPKTENFSVPARELIYNVKIAPLNFTWLVPGSHSSWKEYGNWINRLNEGSEDLTESDKQNIRNLVSGVKDTLKIIELLYQYLQKQTRYINVSIGPGGLKPYPASYVIKNNYGDCKALSVFMKAMLSVANITSYYTLVYAGTNSPEIITEIPCLQFNHAILTIPLSKDTIFLDCTSKNVPAGYTGTFIQGRYALLVKDNGSHLVKIPHLEIADVMESSNHNYTLEENNCLVSINNAYKGYIFDFLSSIRNSLDYATTERFLKERFMNFSSFELNHWQIHSPNTDSAKIQLNASLQLHNFLRSYGNALGFNLYPLYFPVFEKPANRKLPLYIEYPIFKNDSFQYRLQSLKVIKIPDEIILNSKFGTFQLKASLHENLLVVHRSLVLKQGRYDLKEYSDFYAFIQKVVSSSNPTILLTK